MPASAARSQQLLPIPPVIPEIADEKRRYEDADRRRELRRAGTPQAGARGLMAWADLSRGLYIAKGNRDKSKLSPALETAAPLGGFDIHARLWYFFRRVVHCCDRAGTSFHKIGSGFCVLLLREESHPG